MNGIPWWYLYRCPDNGLPRPDLSRLDPGGVLERTIGLERVIGCMINSANMIVEPGVIRNSPGTQNRFTLGEPDGTISRRLQTISAGLRARRRHDPGHHDDPQRDLGQAAAQPQHQPDLRHDRRADRRASAVTRSSSRWPRG